MAIDNVNIGVVANDKTGDPLRTSFDKINQSVDTLKVDKLDKILRGTALGVASLDEVGKVPMSQLPTYPATEFPPGYHTHGWNEVTGKPVEFPPAYHHHDDRYATKAHAHTQYEPTIATKGTAFNKDFGTTLGTVAQGNDSRIANGQVAFDWGNHNGLYSLAAHNHDGVYAPVSHTHVKADITDFAHTHTKSEVGLANVDNTSDANKPVSTAQQTALDSKIPKGTNVEGFWRGTQAEYDAIGTKVSTTIYFII